MDNELTTSNNNAMPNMDTLKMAAMIGAGALMAFSPLLAIVAIAAIFGAVALGKAVTEPKARTISYAPPRPMKLVESEVKAVEQTKKIEAPKKEVAVAPVVVKSSPFGKREGETLAQKEESLKQLGALLKETEALVKANEQTPREKLAYMMGEIAIERALWAIDTPPSMDLSIHQLSQQKEIKNPNPNGGLKILNQYSMGSVSKILKGQRTDGFVYKTFKKNAASKFEKHTAEAAEQEKNLGIKISESEVQDAITKMAKYDVAFGKAGITLDQWWPELMTKAKTISTLQFHRNDLDNLVAGLSPEELKPVAPQKEKEPTPLLQKLQTNGSALNVMLLDKALAGLSEDDLKIVSGAKAKIKSEDHSVQKTEAPKLMSVPRASGVQTMGQMM